MTPEGRVKHEIKKGLEAYNCYYFMPVQTGYGKRTVDILACFYGKFIGIEVKNPINGMVTTNQRNVLHAIFQAGGVSIVATNWNEVKQILDRIKHGGELNCETTQ